MKKYINVSTALIKNNYVRSSLFVFSFLLIIAGAILMSQQAWGDYESSYKRLFNVAKTDIDNVILQDSSTTESIERLNKIHQVQNRLVGEVDSYCRVNPLIGWQSSFSQFSSKIDECGQQRETYVELLMDIGEIVVYLRAEHELTVIISVAIEDTSQNNQSDKWKNIESIWRQASNRILELTDAEQFAVIKITSNMNVLKIADAWKQLSDANVLKDRVKFDSAQLNVDKAYKLLNGISSLNKTELGTLLTEFSGNYSKI